MLVYTFTVQLLSSPLTWKKSVGPFHKRSVFCPPVFRKSSFPEVNVGFLQMQIPGPFTGLIVSEYSGRRFPLSMYVRYPGKLHYVLLAPIGYFRPGFNIGQETICTPGRWFFKFSSPAKTLFAFRIKDRK